MNIELLYWVIGVLWVIGWVKELATIQSKIDETKTSYPYPGAEYVVAVILLVAWPYFYFYGKA